MEREEREYRIDFFQLSVVATGAIGSAYDVFSEMADGKLSPVGSSGGFTREIFDLSRRSSSSSFTGQFRKFRTTDLPEIERTGKSEEELELAEGEGLIERNFFIYYRRHDILGWHVNGHASTPKQLANFVSQAIGSKVVAAPIPVAGAFDRLLKGGVEVKRITATVARPTNADLVADDNFSDEAMALLTNLGGDTMHFSIGIDGRRDDSNGRLKPLAKQMLQSLLKRGATTARADVIEDGIEYPIDCNDPPLPAQVRPLKHTPQRVFSSSAPDGVADGCRSGSSRQSYASHGSGFRSDAGARTAPSRCG